MAEKIILAHYMPWFTAGHSKSKPRAWHHWQGEGNLGKFDLKETGEPGRRRIASHYYPLCGPYDSTDPHVIDEHLRLMKESSVHGIIVDWLGDGHHIDLANKLTVKRGAQFEGTVTLENDNKITAKYVVVNVARSRQDTQDTVIQFDPEGTPDHELILDTLGARPPQ